MYLNRELIYKAGAARSLGPRSPQSHSEAAQRHHSRRVQLPAQSRASRLQKKSSSEVPSPSCLIHACFEAQRAAMIPPCSPAAPQLAQGKQSSIREQQHRPFRFGLLSHAHTTAHLKACGWHACAETCKRNSNSCRIQSPSRSPPRLREPARPAGAPSP